MGRKIIAMLLALAALAALPLGASAASDSYEFYYFESSVFSDGNLEFSPFDNVSYIYDGLLPSGAYSIVLSSEQDGQNLVLISSAPVDVEFVTESGITGCRQTVTFNSFLDGADMNYPVTVDVLLVYDEDCTGLSLYENNEPYFMQFDVVRFDSVFADVAYSLYDGNISSNYITLLRDLVGKVDPFADYVAFRSGQHDYVIISGDIECIAGDFTGKNCNVVRVVTDPEYSTRYEIYETNEVGIVLSAGSSLVYSNLGAYPDLIDRTSVYSFASLVLLLICVFLYLIRSVFAFTYRRR